jgi:hypothetical protein
MQTDCEVFSACLVSFRGQGSFHGDKATDHANLVSNLEPDVFTASDFRSVYIYRFAVTAFLHKT